MKTHASEGGQVLVLILLAIAGLMGFAALAVDGGHVYSERRRAQTAADAAALAAARKGASMGSETDIRSAGINLAQANGFSQEGRTTVQINHPPVSPSPYAGNDHYYQAIITTQIDPIFSQFVFTGPQIITTEAVVQAADSSPASGGNAIFAVDPVDGDTGIDFNGNIGIYVDGGNIFSNSNAVKTGKSGKIVTENGGKIFSHGDFDRKGATCGSSGTVTISPCPTTGVLQQSAPEIPEPYCPPEGSAPVTYNGVKYFTWSGNPSSPMQPGIHCLYGGIVLHGGKITGNDVLLVLKDGDISLNGNSALDLTRASDIKDKNGNQYGGLLLYVSKDAVGKKGTPIVTLGGTNDSKINGTVYAPKATCDLGGTSQANAFHTAFICNTFKFHGTTDLYIVYKDVENFQFAPSLSVSQ